MSHLLPEAQGRHHRRPESGGAHAKRRAPRLSASDRRWLIGCAAYLIVMALLARIGGGEAVMALLTLSMIGLLIYRSVHHTGDRRFNGLAPDSEEGPSETEETGPVLLPTAMSSTPSASGGQAPRTTVPATWRSAVPQLLALGGAALLAGLAARSEHQAQQARRVGDDMDQLLGIPGAWNGYQPTIPAMGTRGWGPPPPLPQYGLDYAKRQQAALMGYDRDRMSGANQEKWQRFFS